MVIPSVRPVHNYRNKKNRNGRYPIHLEIRIGSKRKYYQIEVPQKVANAEWSGKDDGWVKQAHPFAFEINNEIRKKKSVVTDLIKRFYSFTQSLNFPVIFQELKKKANSDIFNAYFQEYNNAPTDGVNPDTLKKYRACLHHLNQFNSCIRFYDLTPELVEDFHQYLMKEATSKRKKTKGLEGSTIDSYFDAFRKIVGLARRSHLITKDHEESLFEDLKIDIKKSKRTFLSIEELRQWKNLVFTEEQKHLNRTRNQYLLQVYTGFYYKDLINLKKEYLYKDHEYGYMILGERDKNDEQNIIPLFRFPDANAIMEEFASIDPGSLYVFDSNYFLAEPVYNRQLKDVAALAGISKSVSNKTARHTNAQLWIRLGATKPIVKKMLGHQKDETTDVYFRVDVTEVIEGTQHVDFKVLGI